MFPFLNTTNILFEPSSACTICMGADKPVITGVSDSTGCAYALGDNDKRKMEMAGRSCFIKY